MLSERRFHLALAAVALIAAVSYANTLSYGAAWDDTRFVFASGAPEGVSGIPSMFTHVLVRDMPPGRGAYRPVTGSSYALDWSLGGGQASFFHWTNTALHAGVTALVLLVLVQLGATLLAALAGALVFAVHPVHVEAVANLAGRSELLVAVFSMGGVAVYLAATRSGSGRAPASVGVLRMAALLLCYAGAAGSKENGIMLPGLLVLVEALRPGASGSAVSRVVARWPVWLGMGVLGIGYMLARLAVLGTFTTWDIAPYIVALPSLTRVTTAIANLGEYARLHLFPLDLSVDYGPALILPATPGSARFWIGLAVATAVFATALRSYRNHRLATLGFAWFAVAILPVSNLLVPIAQWLAERFFYLPSVGLSMAIAALVAVVPSRLQAREIRLAGAAGIVALGLLAARTWTRNQTWEDTGTVLATLVAEHPEAFRAQWFVGRLYFEQGRLDEAFVALDSATALNPNAIEIPLERAEWLLRLGRATDAEEAMLALPERRHANREAFLARALLMQGRSGEADSVIAHARAIFPANPGLRALEDSVRTLPGVRPEPGR